MDENVKLKARVSRQGSKLRLLISQSIYLVTFVQFSKLITFFQVKVARFDPTSFPLVTSPKIGISAKNFQTFNFNPFVTLL